MAYTEIKQKEGKKYYYRAKSIRKGKRVEKKRIYLGANLSKQQLKQKEEKADKELMPKTSIIEEKEGKGITAEKDDFSEWFTQIMLKADLADYTDVSGSIVFKPTAYAIWEKIKQEVDKRFKKLGIKNTYFPLFIPEKLLNKEKEHVKGFSPEVAWVTQTGNTKLKEKLAVRPTSETIMYPSYSKWIRSWKDLPLRLNQWNNVVRWEFRHPVPFLRTREFLWNELHTALATEKEALKEGKEVIKAYNEVTENLMALYGEYGRKTDKEKFAGAVFSEKIHYILPNGKAIEGCPFHFDGQNFAKAYDITFLDKKGKKQYVYQNTYAISTRMLGVMFAIHSDKKGLILPPKISPIQIIIIPIFSKKNKKIILKESEKIKEKLKQYSVELDDREDYTPGYKFNEYELKGIPLRIEIGGREIKQKSATLVRRDTLKKQVIKISVLNKKIPDILEDIQNSLYEKSKKLFKSKLEKTDNLEGLKRIIKNKKVGIVPLCQSRKCEDMVKFKTGGAKALFITKEKPTGKKCVICNKKAEEVVYIARSY